MLFCCDIDKSPRNLVFFCLFVYQKQNEEQPSSAEVELEVLMISNHLQRLPARNNITSNLQNELPEEAGRRTP